MSDECTCGCGCRDCGYGVRAAAAQEENVKLREAAETYIRCKDAVRGDVSDLEVIRRFKALDRAEVDLRAALNRAAVATPEEKP